MRSLSLRPSTRPDPPLDRPLDDPAHGPPGDAHHLRHGRPVRDARELRGHLLQFPREPAVRGGPASLLGHHATARARDAAWHVGRPESESAKRQVPPIAELPTIAAGSPPGRPQRGLRRAGRTRRTRPIGPSDTPVTKKRDVTPIRFRNTAVTRTGSCVPRGFWEPQQANTSLVRSQGLTPRAVLTVGMERFGEPAPGAQELIPRWAGRSPAGNPSATRIRTRPGAARTAPGRPPRCQVSLKGTPRTHRGRSTPVRPRR